MGRQKERPQKESYFFHEKNEFFYSRNWIVASAGGISEMATKGSPEGNILIRPICMQGQPRLKILATSCVKRSWLLKKSTEHPVGCYQFKISVQHGGADEM